MPAARNVLEKAAFFAVFLVCALTGCDGSKADSSPQSPSSDKPLRVVSLDYCADQYVLKFVDRENVLAISPDATADFSYMRDTAVGVPTVRPLAENILILKPDLIVRLYGGGPNATAFFERAGIPVLNIGWAGNIDDVMANIERVASELGAAEQGQAVIDDMQRRLSALVPPKQDVHALYMTPAGVTTGPGSLVHEIMVAAGVTNFQKEGGWRSLPLERLAYEQPDLIAASFFGTLTNHPDAWSPSKHPVAKTQLNSPNLAKLDGAWTACGGWFLMDAVEALAEAAAR